MNQQHFEFIYKVIRQKFRSQGLPAPSRQDTKLLIATHPAAMKAMNNQGQDIVERAYQVANILALTADLVKGVDQEE